MRKREDRLDERNSKKQRIEEEKKLEAKVIPPIGATVDIPQEVVEEEENMNLVEEVAVQCELMKPKTDRWNINMFKNNPKAIKYYTGFDTIEHFNLVFNLLGPAASI